MMTQTTAGASAGYTFSQAYDSTTGQLTGLSNNGTGVANLATRSFNTQGLASDVNFQTTTGTQLANDHFVFDGDLRPASTTATWQSGSGATGTIFSSSRAYDAVGNVTSVSNTQATISGLSSSGGSEVQNFCYDEQNRLLWAGNGGTQPGAGNGTCGSNTLANSLSGAGYSNSTAYTNLGQIWQGPLNGSGTAQQYLYCDSAHPHQLKGLYPLGTTCSNPTGATYTASYDAWGMSPVAPLPERRRRSPMMCSITWWPGTREVPTSNGMRMMPPAIASCCAVPRAVAPASPPMPLDWKSTSMEQPASIPATRITTTWEADSSEH
jgi:hypothetical protein